MTLRYRLLFGWKCGADGRTDGHRTDVRTDTFEIDFKDFPGPSGGEFKKCLSREPDILQLIINRTNRKGQRAAERRQRGRAARGRAGEEWRRQHPRASSEEQLGWKEVSREEMLVFLAIRFTTFVARPGRVRDLWAIDNPFVSPVYAMNMTQRRYAGINAAFTGADQAEDVEGQPADLQEDDDEEEDAQGDEAGPQDGAPDDGAPDPYHEATEDPVNKGWKVERMSRLFSASWAAAFQPGQGLSIDEATVSFRGRCRYRVAMKAKPQKTSLKLFCLADAATAYCLRLTFSSTADSLPLGRELGEASAAVLNLLEDADDYSYRHRSHVVITDNYC